MRHDQVAPGHRRDYGLGPLPRLETRFTGPPEAVFGKANAFGRAGEFDLARQAPNEEARFEKLFPKRGLPPVSACGLRPLGVARP